MPLSNMAREGYQNKIAEVLAKALGADLIYFWRPYLERGLTRETFETNVCDVLLDLPADYFARRYTADPLILFRIFQYPSRAIP